MEKAENLPRACSAAEPERETYGLWEHLRRGEVQSQSDSRFRERVTDGLQE